MPNNKQRSLAAVWADLGQLKPITKDSDVGPTLDLLHELIASAQAYIDMMSTWGNKADYD